MRRIYLDHIAATPLLPAAREAMLPFLTDCFGNPQSRHGEGAIPREAIAAARSAVADLIGAQASEVIFTASGSEANNLAIKGVVAGVVASHRKKGRHLVVSTIEHFSVAHPIKRLSQEGFEVTWIPVDGNGRVDPKQVADALRPDTILVSVMHANNEIGTLQPIIEIAEIANAREIPFHTDAVGTVGIVPFDVARLGVDLAAFSAQSFQGPKGAGALFVRRGTRISPLVEGGVQEAGRRAGTENVAAIVGMGVAARQAGEGLVAEGVRLTALRDRLIAGLLARVDRIHLTGHPHHRLPQVASFAIEFLDGEALIRTLERHGIVGASGSSCSAEALKISPVLTALGLPANVAQGGVVFSLGRQTTEADIETVLETVPVCIERMRQVSPIYGALRSGAKP
jgi:cysteine desulfurase